MKTPIPFDEAFARFSERLDSWSRAYPTECFPEPDLVQARKALAAAGMTLDDVSAACMRHVVTRINAEFDVVRGAMLDAPKASTPARKAK